MNNGFGTIRKLRVMFLGATLAVLTAGVASAAIPGINGTINACYDKQSGQVRLVDPSTGTPKTCGPKENPVSWNVQGAPGADGTDGTDGTDGISGYERVFAQSDLNSNYDKTEWATCPDGKKVIGGGAGVYGEFTGDGQVIIHGVALIQSHPANDNAYAARAEEIVPTDLDWQLDVWAICATVN